MSISARFVVGGTGAVLSGAGIAAARCLLAAAASPADVPGESPLIWREDDHARDFMRGIGRLVTCAGAGAGLLAISAIWRTEPTRH